MRVIEMSPHRQQLNDSLRIRPFVTAGDVLRSIQRGVLPDLVSSWNRWCRAWDREPFTVGEWPVPPAICDRQITTWDAPRIAFQDLLANLDALDAQRCWCDMADVVVKLVSQKAGSCGLLAFEAALDGDDTEAYVQAAGAGRWARIALGDRNR